MLEASPLSEVLPYYPKKAIEFFVFLAKAIGLSMDSQ
jgi:hypothetical protein